MKTLIALQAWAGDLERAVELSRFWCDLQGQRDGATDLMLVCRYDCKPPEGWAESMSGSFKARAVVSGRIGEGWPEGCNQLWFGTIEHCLEMARSGEVYDAILTLEADTTPLQRDWTARLSSEFMEKRVKVMGAYMDGPDVHCSHHINGNMMISGDLDTLESINSWAVNPLRAAWDVWIWPRLRTIPWANTEQIFNCWNSETIDPGAVSSWRSRGVTMIHGVKDRSCLNAAKAILL